MSGQASCQRALRLAWLALTVSVTLTVAAGTPSPQLLERVHVLEEVPQGAAVRVVNLRGDVRLRFGGHGRQLEVLGNLQQLDPDDARLEVAVEHRPHALEVVVRCGADREGLNARADLTVLVPAAVAVEVVSGSGLVEARGLRSDLAVTSADGEILVSGVTGALCLASERGRVSVVLEPPLDERLQTITTATGDVTVSLAAPRSVLIATSGRICSDFSTEIEHRPLEEPDKLARIVVGAGGAPLHVTSRRGDVLLARRPDPIPASTDEGTDR